MKDSPQGRTPAWQVSLLPFALLVILLFFVIKHFGSGALDGGSQVALLISTRVALAIALLIYRIPWETVEKAMAENIRSIGTAVIILLLIGAISGSWMVSGKLVREGRFDEIEKLVREAADIVKEIRG